MNTTVREVWTPDDEVRLVELQERRERIMTKQNAVLLEALTAVNLAGNGVLGSVQLDMLVETLPHFADRLVEVLRPFCTQAAKL